LTSLHRGHYLLPLILRLLALDRDKSYGHFLLTFSLVPAARSFYLIDRANSDRLLAQRLRLMLLAEPVARPASSYLHLAFVGNPVFFD
jgi:hypothetical protein